jgi:hypothetical protein
MVAATRAREAANTTHRRGMSGRVAKSKTANWVLSPNSASKTVENIVRKLLSMVTLGQDFGEQIYLWHVRMKLALMIHCRHQLGILRIGARQLTGAGRLPTGRTVNNWWIVTEKHKFGSY